jgi:two-component system phosphate regulon response regulator PhoB
LLSTGYPKPLLRELPLNKAFFSLQRNDFGVYLGLELQIPGFLFMLSLDPPLSPSSPELAQATRILVVEDEDLIREMLVLALEEEGYEVVTAVDGRTALALLQDNEPTYGEFPFNLLILDLMLPQVNGLDLCRLLRYQGNPVPILILSAKASETDRVLGLEVGADDYLTKPFSMRELIARTRALLRRQRLNYLPQRPALQLRDVTLYPQECRVTVRGEEINLSPKEFRLLELFMTYPRRVWSREQLIDHVWGPDFLGDTKTVDVHIRWLREKLERDPSHPEYVITVRGFGYRFS